MSPVGTRPFHDSSIIDDITELQIMDNHSCGISSQYVNTPTKPARHRSRLNGGKNVGIIGFVGRIVYRMYLVAKAVAIHPFTPTIVDFHAGIILVDSRNGRGSKFDPMI